MSAITLASRAQLDRVSECMAALDMARRVLRDLERRADLQRLQVDSCMHQLQLAHGEVIAAGTVGRGTVHPLLSVVRA